MCLKDKTALITGAGGGIGRETVKALADAGAKVILFGGRNAVELQKTAEIITNNGGVCKVISGDLTDDKIFEDAFNKAIEGESKIDILINNAGVAHNDKFDTVTTELFNKIMKINVQIPYFLTQKTLPYLKKSDSATIINVASVVAHAGYENQSVYTASKHALLGFTKSIAVELYKENVRVHAISPGGVYTDMIKVSRPDLSSEGMIMPKDIVDIIMFILTHRSNAVIDEIMIHRVGKQPFLV
ncbi:MAG: SDR family oxidoreductase [Clostridia bacterium]|nr:SDR family oxidoreductase [Clostridia bacterium]